MRRLALVVLVVLAGCAATEREPDDAGVDAAAPADAAAPDVFEFVDAHGPDATPDAAPDAGAPDAAAAVCGNGVREGSEECDDGNHVVTDGCINCKWARCGDGVTRTGVEECDDGNTANGDSCSAVCLACNAGDGHFTWPVNNHCYTRFAAAVTWDAGKTVCANVHAHLATLTSDAENGAIVQNLISGTVNHWIGFHDIDVEGRYDWVTAEPNDGYSHFTDGEPNNDGNEDCIETSSVGLWNDNKCSATRAVLCEDEGWFIRPVDNHAYHVTYRATTWSDAAGQCSALGAHLATPTSADEEAFIEAHAFGNLWAGLTDAALEGTYVWVTGEPYVYTDWQANEPSNGGGNEDCLELSVGRGWNDLACSEQRGFICEKD